MKRLIDMDALLEHVIGLPTWWGDTGEGGAVYCSAGGYPNGMFDAADIVEAIKDAPTQDAVPVRHGKWLNSHHTQIVTCSLCGSTVQTNWRGFYCQNCGAKMDGGAGDEPDA